MNKDIKVYLLILALSPLAMPNGARGQALGEFAGVNAGVAGMGAGVAASMGNGALVRRTYESAAQAQQAMMAQNQAVEQYFKMGNQFEMKKQWENAEKAFTYVLQVIARRDGAGSAKSVPALKHLAAISQQQNRLDQAISYQKTVLAFTKAAKVPDKIAIVEESVNLSKILIKKAEYSLAEPIMRESVALAKQTTMPRSDYQTTLQVYGRVLRQLNRQEEAQAIEAEILPPSTGAAPGSSPVTTTAAAAVSVPNSTATMLTIAPPPAATTTSNTNGGAGAAASGTGEGTGSTSASTSTTDGTSVTAATPATTQPEPTESWKPANSEPEPTPMPMPMPGAYSAPDPATVSKTAAPTSPPANTEAAAPIGTTPAAPQQSSSAPPDMPEPQPMPMPIALPDGSTIPVRK